MGNVAVLGCGPAGLLVAYAVEQHGHQPVIYSRKQKSKLPGSLHLRRSIPDLTSDYPDATVHITRLGYAEDYAHKVYGSSDHASGWSNYFTIEASWNLEPIYDKLWDRYIGNIIDSQIDFNYLLHLEADYDLVISTLPQNLLCIQDHQFRGVRYWIRALPTPADDEGREVIIYNGLPEDHWYRYSILGNKCALESTRRMEGAVEGIKVLDTDCICRPNVVRAGRWAQWRHGVLLHDAYQIAGRACEEWL